MKHTKADTALWFIVAASLGMAAVIWLFVAPHRVAPDERTSAAYSRVTTLDSRATIRDTRDGSSSDGIPAQQRGESFGIPGVPSRRVGDTMAAPRQGAAPHIDDHAGEAAATLRAHRSNGAGTAGFRRAKNRANGAPAPQIPEQGALPTHSAVALPAAESLQPTSTAERVVLANGTLSRGDKDKEIELPWRIRTEMNMTADNTVVRATVCVDRRGRPEQVELERSSGHQEADEIVRQELRSWRYRPYRVDGRATPFCERLAIAFAQ